MLLLLQNAYDLFRGHSLLFQLQAVFYQNLFPNGGIQTVYDEDFAFIILGSDRALWQVPDSLLEIVTTMTVSPADTAFS